MPTKTVNGVRVELTEQEILEKETDEKRALEKKRSKYPEKIKEEATKRIPDQWKQLNVLMENMEFVSKQIDAIISHLKISDPLTVQEIKKKKDNFKTWNEIKRLRQKSNELESMSPDDFTDDKYWKI